QAERGLGVSRLGDVAEEQQIGLRQRFDLGRQRDGGLHAVALGSLHGWVACAVRRRADQKRKSISTPKVRGWIGTASRCEVTPLNAPWLAASDDQPVSPVALLI